MEKLPEPAQAGGSPEPPSGALAGTVLLHLPARHFSLLLPLWQRGFWLRLPASGQSIQTILCHYLRLSPEYLEKRIQTIFLNGKPVDELEQTMVSSGDCLALSAAMPGLVGATFRKKGVVALLRAGITSCQTWPTVSAGPCWLRLKLFNLLAQELGPGLLSQGVWIAKKELLLFLQGQSEDFWNQCGVAWDGHNLSAAAVAALPWAEEAELIFLQTDVHTAIDTDRHTPQGKKGHV
ncbi:MAG: hypothetical protein ACUVRZ_03195 [Desulfobacca sp.]|uniref:hypothetical protein n=1 Tax=Desulfobacca sp. TaxID=2067990 RepID=UPI0040492ADE